jgi:hypothetical protein
MLIGDRSLIVSSRPSPFAASFVSVSLELPDAVLDPMVNARRQRLSEKAEVDEEAQKTDIEDGDYAGECDDKCETEDVDVARCTCVSDESHTKDRGWRRVKRDLHKPASLMHSLHTAQLPPSSCIRRHD